MKGPKFLSKLIQPIVVIDKRLYSGSKHCLISHRFPKTNLETFKIWHL